MRFKINYGILTINKYSPYGEEIFSTLMIRFTGHQNQVHE
jgi:hypothetical protein